MRTLVLWDVDRTLVAVPLGVGWVRRALVELTGRDITGDMPRFEGRTDRWVAHRLLAEVGVEPTDDVIASFHTAMARIAHQEQHRIAEVGTVLAGVPEVLQAIAGRPEAVQTLVTGNLRPTAALKVSAFGLDKYLQLDIGGYGGMSAEREPLVAEAIGLSRRRYGQPERIVVVGDTQHDVRAALAHDATAIAVATGGIDAGTLRAAGAHVVLPDLTDTERALAAILPS